MKKFKVMGIGAGRKNGNSEILLKEALLVCQQQGAEVTMINLHDYNIEPCTGCECCTMGMAQGKKVDCTLIRKDDKDKITKVMLEQDAVIFGVPTYDLMPASIYLTFAHRNLAYESSFLQAIGAIEKKDRIAGIISVGGSTHSWQAMALEAMQATTFTQSFKIIDMMMGMRSTRPGQVLLYPKTIERAKKLGENIMKSLNTPVKKRDWLGDEGFGWCPNCHSNALVRGEVQWDGTYWPIECQVCGAGGDLVKDENGKWKFVIAENGLIRDRTCDEGREHHLIEIGTTQKEFFSPEGQKIYHDKIVKYKNIKFPGIE